MRTDLRSAGLAVLVLVCVLVIPAVRAQDDAAKALPAMEKALWDAWSKGDVATFEKHLAQNTVSVNAQRIQVGKAHAIEEMKKTPCKVASYSLGDVQVTRAGDATAILTYTATQDATCGGQKLPAKVNVSSVWVKQGTQWVAALYHETGTGQ
jgi:ketosteroid isomerase-like protein